MNLNAIRISASHFHVPRKILLAMKLTTFLLLISIMTVSAATFAQKITLNEKKASLEQVLKKIRIQSGYDIVCSDDLLTNTVPVTVEVKDVTLEEALKASLKNQPLTFEIEDGAIVFKAKETTFLGNLQAAFSTIDVHGKIVDEKGQPLPGVTIKTKDESQVTQTDKDGNFTLKKVDDKAVIVVSFIGYLTKELNAIPELGTIALTISNSKLDEVQIMAYGQTSRRISTATIGTLKAEDIAKQPVSDPLATLQGRIPGLLITPTSGNAGAPFNVQIRGQNSLNFKGNPLFIVDNVPVDNNNFTLGFTITQNLSPFSYLNPNDIESIDVLKDADATSIYGSRGANGVILITTKKGKAGKTVIDLNSQVGYGEVAKKLDLLNTPEYIAMRKEAYKNDGLSYTSGAISNQNADLRLYDQNSYTDWQKVMIGGHAQYRDYQGNISGGNTLVQYIVGGNFHRETTVYPGGNFNSKGGMHFSLSGSSANQKLKVVFTGNYLADKMTGQYDYTRGIFSAPNSPSLLNGDGTINWSINPATGISTRLYINPYAGNLITDVTKVNNLISGVNVSYEPFKGLRLQFTGGYNKLLGNNVDATPITSYQPYYLLHFVQENLRSTRFQTNTAESWSAEPQLKYRYNRGKSSLEVLAGGSFQSQTSTFNDLELRGFTSDALLFNQGAASTVDAKRNTSAQYKYAAIFSRITYKWDDKYIFDVNARRDGSSRFGPGNEFGNFGSLGAAWIFSQEAFVKDNLPFLSFGKAKFSYGISGNDGIGDYAYLESYSLTQTAITYQGNLGYTSNGIVNPDYHWENVKKMEFGLDLGFLKDRILLQANYFRNRSDDQLIYYPSPALAGYGAVFVNLPAKLQNTGLELSLNTTNIKSTNFSWSSAFTYTSNRNKLLSYPGIDQTAYYLTQIGQPFYGYVNVYRFAGVNPATGEYQFFNKDGSTTATPTDSGPPYYGQDARIITYPKFYGGLSNTLTYHNFSLDFFLQFTKQTGIDPIYQAAAARTPGLERTNIFQQAYDHRWQAIGDQSQYMKLSTTFNYFDAASKVSSSNIGCTDASFIRLKNLSFSYNLPETWLSKYGIQKCRLYLQGQNIYTLTKYKGLDPETQSLTSLPPLRVWTVGLQLGL